MTTQLPECCATCNLYRHVPAEQRTGKQWNYATGRCGFKPPSSKRSIPPKVNFDAWCENWKEAANMDVSKAIIKEGNRRYAEKMRRLEGKDGLDMLEPEEMPLKEAGEAHAAERAKDVTPEQFVDRSYRSPGTLFPRSKTCEHAIACEMHGWPDTCICKQQETIPQEGETVPELKPDPLTEAFLHVYRRVADVENEEGRYATLVSCDINALKALLNAVSEKVELPTDD